MRWLSMHHVSVRQKRIKKILLSCHSFKPEPKAHPATCHHLRPAPLLLWNLYLRAQCGCPAVDPAVDAGAKVAG